MTIELTAIIARMFKRKSAAWLKIFELEFF